MSNSIAKNSPYRWPALFLLTGLGICAMRFIQFPAAPMLGAMIAAILTAVNVDGLKLPNPLFLLGQGVIGLMIGLRLPRDFLSELQRSWPLFIGGVAWAILAAILLGWILTKWNVFPGTTAIWGLSPGAAGAMTVMSEEFGGDIRLVAFMQYLRVIMVVVVMAILARFWVGAAAAAATEGDWTLMPSWKDFFLTLGVIAAALLAAKWIRMPAGSILGPMAAGMIINYWGEMRWEQPWWLLPFGSMLMGWSIGLRFDRRVLGQVARSLPKVLFAILALIGLCGAFAAFMTRWAGIDPLTAYLAASPGGLDSIAIIAASAKVDMSFVLAMHTARFLLVVLTGPWLAKQIVLRTGRGTTGREKP